MNTNDLRILVTGGAGFIGSNIVESLLKQGVKQVRILDNLVTGKMENIQFLLDKYDNVEFMYGSIADLETCRKAVKDVDVITNQAALGSVPRSVNDPLSSHIANVNGFLNILVAAKEEGIKRVVYASSSSVYGDNPVLPKVEENTGNVLSPYAATKAIDEIYAGVFSKCYGMECIGLRYFNIFGPRQDPNGAYAAVIPKFIDLMKDGTQPVINGDGTFSRDFTYIENAVQANILGLTTENEECFGEAFNIGAGGQFSLLELITILNKELKTEIVPLFGENRPGDIPHSFANISKAQRMIGYDPKISFEDGIHKLISFNNNKDNTLALLNPAAILSKNKSEYILDYILNENDDISIYIDKNESDGCNNYLIPGNKEFLKLNYAENKNSHENETTFGIISYNEPYKYGKLSHIPESPKEIIEPVRVLMDKNIFEKFQKLYKKLIIINTEFDEPLYYDKDVYELLNITNINNYVSSNTVYKSKDTEDRNRGLYGKFYDALNYFQQYNIENITNISIEGQNLCKWYSEYNAVNDLLAQDITNTLNSIFKKKGKYLFQNNNPVRISTKNSKGTPLHQDSQSIIINKSNINNFKNGSYLPKEMGDTEVLIETHQSEKIFNFNYTIYEDFPSQSMRLCEHSNGNMQDKSYFYRVKQNKPNEAFLFNPSNLLHFRQNQYNGISIRGDIRIIELNDYKTSNLKNVTGPRQNSNVCFSTVSDCKDTNSKYSVFSDKIYE
jgi:UDP-N-acetylglucosamine/UDP-N-acetylgalactosamine 4-epimerase